MRIKGEVRQEDIIYAKLLPIVNCSLRTCIQNRRVRKQWRDGRWGEY